jgi:aspartate-semialdehyde dehydrogenase
MKFALVGATGLVGQEVLKVLEERSFPFKEFFPVASQRSSGSKVNLGGKEYTVLTIEEALEKKPDLAIFSAGSKLSLEYAPKFRDLGAIVVDNSSAWRMHPQIKLIVPEVNAELLKIDDRIIANPNCSTIQLVVPLHQLHKKYHVKRVVVSTYQSVTGTGKEAVDQLMKERGGDRSLTVYPHPIDLNMLPHIDEFMENGYTKEEMKMVNETKKIMGDERIALTATCVRVPAIGGHAEAVNITFEKDFEILEVKELLGKTQGVVVQDEPANHKYPTPIQAQGRDEIFVGRIRRDESQPNSLNLWIVADNLRKGAATNAVQIAEYMLQHSMVF